jgi:Rps23 Pro-64 3,4-dihydroxylase Tpa1-like proline 4-hydroxylase
MLEFTEELHENHSSAQPFPHSVLDNLWGEDTLHKILEEWPKDENPSWYKKIRPHTYKWAMNNLEAMGPVTRAFLQNLNSPETLAWLEKVTGIQGLVADPTFEGGGLHHIPVAGYLKMHSDFNWHPGLQMRRRVNMLIYLNDGWEEGNGGELELWNIPMTECIQRVNPVFNRTVIFNTTSDSFHGHPDGGNTLRKSLATYYYSKDRVDKPHSTLYQKRPGEKFLTLEEQAGGVYTGPNA